MIRVSQNNVTCVEDLPVVEYEMPVEPSKDEVVKLITLLFPEEEHQQCAFTQFTDGLTNRLFKIRYSNSETKRELLIRVYGEKTELLIDRDKELSGMIALNQCGLAPPVYGKFTNGVCYGFISGTPFSVDDMKDNGKYPLVAEQLAKFHSAVVPDMEKTPSLFNTLRKWQKEVSHLQLSPSQEEILNGMYSDESFSNELLLLEEKMKDYKNWDIVFCHNDLLAGNLIYKDENVEFIDYEYGSYNYALFDIGNHFCEMMGPEVIVDKFPSKDLQIDWLKNYFHQKSDISYENLFEQTKIMVLAANLYWGVWGLVQHQISTNPDFDYQAYSQKKLKVYYQFKQEYGF